MGTIGALEVVPLLIGGLIGRFTSPKTQSSEEEKQAVRDWIAATEEKIAELKAVLGA